jgi:hypothetical protein
VQNFYDLRDGYRVCERLIYSEVGVAGLRTMRSVGGRSGIKTRGRGDGCRVGNVLREIMYRKCVDRGEGEGR